MNRNSRAFATIEHRVFGVAFLALLLLGGWLTYAIFNKSFTDYAYVTLESDKAGLQLPDNADVKIRGVIVGEVRDAVSTADGVRLKLGIFRDSLSTIPADVSARLLPKTLFGEKYVALQVPESSSGTPIAEGDVIEESEVAIEVEKVLSDIYPLLRTVRPADINYTLTAMATALEGRGESIGENLVILDDYLRRTNPKIPLLVDDLRKLGSVSEVYRDVVPEIANLLRNSVTTGETFVAKEQKIQALFSDVAAFSSTSKDFLEQNGDNIIRLGEQGAAQLPVFEKYAPEYPCLLGGIVDVLPRQEEAFRGYTLHINLETLPRQPRGYTPADAPANGDKRGPIDLQDCNDAVNGRYDQGNLPPDALVPQLNTGVQYPVGKRVAPFGETGIDLTSGFAGTRAERSVVNSVAAPALGVPGDQVPDVVSLLLGPIARGAEVTLR
jgi:phospholipid/cholesterol/gamma-HCH transport system substrate-binding protein